MTLTVVLICAGLLIALGILAVIIRRATASSRLIYGASIVVTVVSLAAALTQLLCAAPPPCAPHDLRLEACSEAGAGSSRSTRCEQQCL